VIGCWCVSALPLVERRGGLGCDRPGCGSVALGRAGAVVGAGAPDPATWPVLMVGQAGPAQGQPRAGGGLPPVAGEGACASSAGWWVRSVVND